MSDRTQVMRRIPLVRGPVRLGVVAAAAVIAACALLVACNLGARADGDDTATIELGPDEALVVKVVDGDTLRVRLPSGREEAVRLIGVDTPESVRPGTPVQCFAKKAAAFLRSLTPPGAVVRLERDVEARDRYGRLLAYVFRQRDGLFVNLELAAQGYARLSTHPPNVAYVDRFLAAVGEAREHDRGLWAGCARTTVP